MRSFAIVIVAVPRWPVRQGPHKGWSTAPAFPIRPLWMWAATARPLSLVKVNRQVTRTRLFASSTALRVKVPAAHARTPVGLGTSARALSLEARLYVSACGEPAASPTRTSAAPKAATSMLRIITPSFRCLPVVRKKTRDRIAEACYACRCASTNHRCLSIALETSVKRSAVSMSSSSVAPSIAARADAP